MRIKESGTGSHEVVSTVAIYGDRDQVEAYPEDWQPSANIDSIDPDLYEVVWNDDYTLFTTRKLFWHDESSYARYQSGDMEHEQVDENTSAPVIDCDIDYYSGIDLDINF
jgi:hypothetical protein